MIKFITAMVNPAGEIVGCVTGDLPLNSGFFWEGCTFVSVAAVVAKEAAQHTLPHAWRRTLHVKDGQVAVHEDAREFVTTIIASPTTAEDVARAERLSPMVAHWLKRCAAPGARLGDAVEAAIAEQPQLADVIESLHTRRHAPEQWSRFRQFAVKAGQIEAAASAWDELKTAANLEQTDAH